VRNITSLAGCFLVYIGFKYLHFTFAISFIIAAITSIVAAVCSFAPWVLVTIFDKPTYIIAWLFIVGGIAGIAFQPFLGWLIDTMGERFVLVSEASILVFVCIGYGFAKSVFPDGNTAYVITAVCFVIDMLLISASMARATYLKKIAIHPSHVAPTLTMGVSIDHAFSIGIAFACGFV
jgi:hypothetical protein